MPESNAATALNTNRVIFASPEELYNRCNQNLNASSVVSIYDILPSEQHCWLGGDLNFWYFNDEFPVGLRDLKIKEDFTTISPLTKTLSFEYVLVGGSDIQLGEKNIYANGMPKIHISSHCDKGQQTRF